jgi:PKD repeat protein
MKHFSLTFLLSALAFLLSGNHAFAQFQRQYGSQGVTFQADKTGTLFSGATAGGEPFGFSEVAVVDSCSCPDGVLSQNLIANGSFTLGNVGFTSQLTGPSNCGPGRYGLVTNFSTFCSDWGPLGPHSGPNFMAIDGKDNGNTTILWQSPVSLTSQTDYCFSFFWALGFAHPSQNFPVSIDILDANGNVVTNAAYHVGDETIASSLTWKNKTINWNSTTIPNGNYFLAIRQLTGTAYRDWGIDDICFTKAKRACTANFTAKPLGINPCGLFQFTSTSIGAVSYSWDFGDPMSGTANNTSTEQIPTHQFSKCGMFTVCLTIKCADGTSSTVCYTVTVTDTILPVARCKPGVGVILNL